jgi:hypothetical protein
MPQLFIGNVTKQIQTFAYRLPERSGVIAQNIPIGGQIRVSPNGVNVDLTQFEIDAIINQHRMYGLMAIDEIDSKNVNFGGTVYSIGKPLSVDRLRRAMIKYEEKLDAMGRKMRQEAALAVNSQIEEQIGAPLRQLEMSFSEEEPRGGFTDDANHIAEGIRVKREAEDGRRTRR